MSETEQAWIKGEDLQKVMVRKELLTPALGSIRAKDKDHSCVRKEATRGRGHSPDWEISPETVQLLIDRGNKGKGGIVLKQDEATDAFLTKHGLHR